MAQTTEVYFEQTRNFGQIAEIAGRAGTLELAIEINGHQKGLAPVDFGQLKNGLQYQTSDGKTGGLNDDSSGKKAEKMTTSLSNNEAAVMSSAEYSLYQEFGTRHQKAQPFFRPGIDLAARRPSEDVKRAIQKEIEDRVKINKVRQKV